METTPSPTKQAKLLEKEGRFAEAAALFEHSGDLDRAIGNYAKAGQVDRAADLLKVNGRGAKAAELYESVSQFAKAGAIYEEIFEFGPAGAAFVKAGEPERAAAMFEQADEFEQAANLYAELGNQKKAAQLFERAGNTAKAAELNASVAQQAAANPAAEIDLSAGVVDGAKVVAAIVSYLRTDRTDDAAHLYGSCQEKIGYPVLAAIAGDVDAERCAAEMFVCSNDFGMAAQVFENLADYQSAAAMYERADDPYVAAEMFVRVGDTAHAAEMYEKSGHYRQAAECYTASGNTEKSAVCYEKAEDNFLAGKLYASLGKPNRALQLLQKVRKGDQDYLEASRLIGEGLVAGGHPELAVKKLQEAVDGVELTEKSAPVFYALASARELSGSAAEALAGWEQLAAWNIDYVDVKQRIGALETRGATAAPPRSAAKAPTAPARPSAFNTGSPVAPGKAAPRAAAAPANLVTVLDGFEFLKSTPLFKELSLDEMKAVYHACLTRRFAPGDVLIEQDQPGEALFVLRKGTARVLRASKDGQEEQVARLGPGSPAGEMALVDDAPTSARVVAESEVEAFSIDRIGFEKLMASSDRMAVKLYRFFVLTLAKRLRQTSQVLAATAAARP